MPPSLEAEAREKARGARLDALHQEKMRSTKSSVDTSSPATYSHLGPGSGKAAVLANARQKEIDAGNSRLLNNLTRIASGGASMDCGQGPQTASGLSAGRTLNSVAQKAEQQRIDEGNSRLLKNLTSIAQKGAYDPATLDADFRKHQEHLARISRFPPPK